MSINEIFAIVDTHSSSLTTFALILSLLIEFTPVKICPIKPITSFAKWLIGKFTKPIEEKIEASQKEYRDSLAAIKTEIETINQNIDAIKTSQDELKESEDFKEAMNSRYRIIRAADEVRNGADLSFDHITQLSEDIDIYDAYCNSHPSYQNHKGQFSKALITAHAQNTAQAQQS